MIVTRSKVYFSFVAVLVTFNRGRYDVWFAASTALNTGTEYCGDAHTVLRIHRYRGSFPLRLDNF